MELTADRAEAGLGGFGLCLVFTHSLRRALFTPICVILNRHS